MRAVTVCVDYSDYLAITLSINRQYFDEFMIVTTPTDIETLQVAYDNECETFITNEFYENGAVFNKWIALEHGLDIFGRAGWLCLLDADIVLPPFIPLEIDLGLNVGNLYVPERYNSLTYTDDWTDLPYNPDEEFAGYCQMFHASDPVLGKPPWHETNWKHAGGADSFFANKWPPHNKLRPPFRVLHVGQSGLNWCGRTTPYLDGSVPALAEQRKNQLEQFLTTRKETHKFRHEKF